MADSLVELLKNTDLDDSESLGTDKLTRVSINRLAFVMKALAEEDLWDEAEEYLKHAGFQDLLMSEEPIRVLQEMIKGRAGSGIAVGKRASRFMNSATCGGGSSPGGGGPAHFPGGGNGGSDGGVKRD